MFKNGTRNQTLRAELDDAYKENNVLKNKIIGNMSDPEQPEWFNELSDIGKEKACQLIKNLDCYGVDDNKGKVEFNKKREVRE